MDDEGRDDLSPDPILQEAFRRGWALWVVDPRGIGELKVANEGFVFATSLLLGENFVWRQAADISRILGDLPKDNRPKGLYARGKTAGLIAAYVAAIAQGDLPTWIALRDAIFSFSNANGLPRHFLAFDAYSVFDIRDLLTVAKPKIFVITDPEEFMRADW